MNLNIFISGQTYYSAEWPITRRIIDEVFGKLQGVDDSATNLTGERAAVEFTLSRSRLNGIEALRNFDSYLHVAINHRTGYGALKWLFSSDSTVSIDAAIAKHVWISDNPTPPEMDPHVISDPDLPRYHHPRSTLPISAVRAATEEFCRAGTGMRPSCIHWTPGDLSGRRLDVPDSKISAAYCDDPWCDIVEPGHPRH
ncbi:Imm1 family immunity protein (plasmid) [Streptomyces sp. HUAS TT11]|uniref:Imm1 family immunity protein n=1 Tax=Streptomyces sp. HUAS TT11 TaxID=3447508 RepID=UPI003F65F220